MFGVQEADTLELEVNSQIFLPKAIIPSKKVAYLPQHSFLPKGKKVRNLIPLFFNEGEKQDKIFYMPKVTSFERVKIGELSLGQLRYLELLIMSNLGHDYLLLDEPFSMIEPIYKEVIKELLLNLKF